MARVILETINLSKAFGGLIAVDNVNLKVEEGELRGLIGPNGAGKTTLFNLITGRTKPTGGRILFNGEDITGLPPYVISLKGISTTFQLTNIFPAMTVLENVWVGINSRSERRWHPFVPAERKIEIISKAKELCESVGLGDKMNAKAAALAYGDKKLLEIALALSTNPSLLLLDEPTQGVSPKEAENIVIVIERLSKIKTIVLIEHNVDVVLRLAKKITVLDRGRVIAEGSADEISENEEVQNIYLGRR